jgi:poly-gamma-glutamate capsule biosynthesis protein CapA/YwtB (metallophosphatase superfamily)
MTTRSPETSPPEQPLVTVFLCGDVMTGRGIDQVLRHPSDPVLYESYMKSAKGYVELAEQANGPIEYPVDFAYIWGDALDELERVQPDGRIINLETSITQSNAAWPGKGIHYRMHPANIPCLTAAKIDCCVLANNHVLDWGYDGLAETLETLRQAHLAAAGAGSYDAEAAAPARLRVTPEANIVVFAFGTETSGIPARWAAGPSQPGVNLLRDLSTQTVDHIKQLVREATAPADIVVASIHWGANWGYTVPAEHIEFAHKLVDEAGIDIVHGHSSHHVQALEVYHHKPIIYGCGDFLTDYEGIGGHEAYRGDLSLMYFVSIDAATKQLARLEMTPMRLRHLRVNRASESEAEWLHQVLNKEGQKFATAVAFGQDHRLQLRWR